MYVLASVLDIESQEKIRDTWKWLEENCSLSGIKLTPLPHISWQAADDYDFNKLETITNKLTSQNGPFCVRVSGIGIFTGVNPVLYATIVKTEKVIDFHKLIWNRTKSTSGSLYEYYSPEYWVPHVTLASRDVTPEKLACAIKGMANKTFQMELWIDNLTCLYVIKEEVGVRFKTQLKN
jgi:2'-5' RNA ligase